jgi:hypothetical protein
MEPTFPPEQKPTQPSQIDDNDPYQQPVSPEPQSIIKPQSEYDAQVTPSIDAPNPTPITQPDIQQNTQPVPSQPLFSPDQPPAMAPINSAGNNGGKKKIFVIITGILAGILLLGGGLAAAYFGVVVPSKPENVLKQALINTAEEKNIALDGQYEMSSIDTSKKDAIPAMKIAFDGKTNVEQKQSELKLNVTVSGVSLPLEARLVGDAAYVKVGDLSTISSLLSGYAPSIGFDPTTLKPLIDDVSGLLSNQWIEFDSTLLDQAQVSCVVDSSFSLTDDDIKLLESQFTNNAFAKIDSNSNDTVDGKSAIKYQISIDDDKLAKFGEDKKLEQLSFIKALEKCPGTKDTTISSIAGPGDGDITPVTIWVDKDTKRITKLAGQSTKQDAEKSNLKASFSANVTYDKVSVSKPENAKPALQIWGDLQQKLTPYFGSLFSGGLESSALDEGSETDIIESEYDDYLTQ